jgi:hypothetical protein
MEGGIRQPDHPMTKECRVGTQLHGQGVKRSLMIPNNFPVCLPAERKGFPLPVCTLWKFSQVQQASLQK